MTKSSSQQKASKNGKDLEAMILDHARDKYKLIKTAIRWALEIKQKENLPDPISSIVHRALEEILTGEVPIEKIEKLPELTQASFAAQSNHTQTLSGKSAKDGKG